MELVKGRLGRSGLSGINGPDFDTKYDSVKVFLSISKSG